MQISDKMVVTIDYTLKDDNGTILTIPQKATLPICMVPIILFPGWKMP